MCLRRGERATDCRPAARKQIVSEMSGATDANPALLRSSLPAPERAAVIDSGGHTMPRAEGTFKLTLIPEHASDPEGIGRTKVDKQFAGDLVGTGQGIMLSALTAVADSAGHVALERVTGTLHGRAGSFALLHRGVMERGIFTVERSVVPDSGTGELVGLRGTFTAGMEGAQHTYVLDYELAP